MECYLLIRGKTLTAGANRLLSNAFPKASDLKRHLPSPIILKTNRPIVWSICCIVDMEDGSILCDPRFKGGKLWTFQQIEHNLGTHFFSECFELEYEHLQTGYWYEKNTEVS